jgi:hypothetical protein
LTIGAFAIPAIVAYRYSVHLDVLKAPEEFIVLGDHRFAPADFYFDKIIKALKEPFSKLGDIHGTSGKTREKCVGGWLILQ